MRAALPGDGERPSAFREALAGRVGGLSSLCTLSFEIKPHGSKAVAAMLGCVWEVCDLTSMRKRLGLRDRKNKQFSPSPGKRLLRYQQPSVVGAVSFQVLQLKSERSLVGRRL